MTEQDMQNEEEMMEFEENAVDELGQARHEIAELKDKHLRAVAEMQNIQRRSQRDVEDAAKYGVTSAAKPLLQVSDNLHRALAAVPNDLPDNIQNLFEGIRATERALQQALEKMGVVAIAAAPGQSLNPHEHEVMFEVDTSEHPHGSIVQVLETGYKIHDRLLRPARVSVAKNANGVAEKTVDFSA
jgi:molecular chaperone GrpE